MSDKCEGSPHMGIVERGTILALNQNNKYNVLSLDRPGISIFSISPINDAVYNIGDKVIFISFPDGTGRIICEL